MKFFIIECVVLISLLQIKCLNSAKILGFFGTASKSHFILQEPVMKELARRGHEVTVVTSYKQTEDTVHLKNYRYITIPDFLNEPLIKSFASEALQSAEKSQSVFQFFGILNNIVGYSLSLMRHPKFLPLKNETFDLLVVGWFMNEYVLGLSGHFHCPAVVISPNIHFYPIRKFSGNPSSVSTIPSMVFTIDQDMTFFTRVLNFLAYIIECIMFEIMFHLYELPYYNEEFPSDKYPSYDEVVKNVSLVLVAQHFSGQVSEAVLPNVIEVEGMHVKKEPSRLPEPIKEFLDSATNGAIFFSLGSNIKSSDLSEKIISILLNKFKGLKQKILWKFEMELPNLPVNVQIGKWLPQDDILAHPNVKLFISHCGKGGITEAKYHGVPILAIPVFADQFSNAKNIVNEGWATILPLADITAETFSTMLDEALNNSTYGNVAMKLSNLNRDRPEHPLDKAVFWIEYVIRHNGAKHMQSPAVHLNLLQYYSLDVYAFILVTCFAIFKFIRIIFNVLLKKVFASDKRKSKKE